MRSNFSIMKYSFCIIQIIINWITTLFAMIFLTIYEAMKIPTSKGTGRKININENI